MSGTPDTKEDKVEMPGLWANFIGVIVASLPRILPIAWIKYWLNHGEELRDKLAALFKHDPRFEEIGSFPVVVPDGYNHGTVIADLHREHHNEFYRWDDASNDFNYANPSNVLTPGHRFKVKMFAVKCEQVVSAGDCLKVLAAYKGVLTGAQGAALAYQQGKSYMSYKYKGFVSFDKKDNLPVLNGYHRVPNVLADTDGSFCWGLDHFDDDWYESSVLLCFCNEES